MARGTVVAGTDRWTAALLALGVAAVASGALLPPAFFSQAQSVDAAAALAGCAGVVAVISAYAAGGSALPQSRVGVAWTAFLGWALLSAVASGRALAAFAGEPTNLLGWWTLAALGAVALAASLRADAGADLLRIAAPWLLAAQVAYVAVRFLMAAGQPFIPDLVGGGSLPNSTAFGEFAVVLLPWVLAPAGSGRAPGLGRTARIVIVAATMVALLVGGSRVGLAVALLWLGWVAITTSKLSARAKSRATVALVLVALAGSAVYVATQWDKTLGPLGLRPEFTRVAVRAVAAAPVLGYGPDGFVAGGTGVSTDDTLASTGPLVFARGSVDPHNALLWVAVSTGVVGLALALWGVVELALAWRARARAGQPVGAAVWSVAGAAVMFVTAPATLAILPLFAFAAGASVPAAQLDQPASGARRAGSLALLAVLGLASLLLALNAVTRFGFERPSAQTTPALAQRSAAAARLWVADPYLYHLASMHLGWASAADAGIVEARADLIAAEKAAALDRRDPFVALELARARAGYRLPEAQVQAAFDETFRRWPVYPLAHAEYASYLASLGRTQEALKRLDYLDGLNADDPEAAATAQSLRARLPL